MRRVIFFREGFGDDFYLLKKYMSNKILDFEIEFKYWTCVIKYKYNLLILNLI